MKSIHLLMLISYLHSYQQCKDQADQRVFPKDFLFGVSTSSYQTEGAWNVSGKGENIWDRFTNTKPEKILDGSNGDIACHSYYQYQEDINLIKDLGVQFYRFSLSWSRILPKGLSYKINPDGIRYYNELINSLLRYNITPLVSLFHWDTPQPLEDLGGFTNGAMVEWFAEYARVAFENFGDRVKLWLTFNEPTVACLDGYGGAIKAPGYNFSGVAEYLCAHNLLKAHARAYHLYTKEFKQKQKGKISLVLPSYWYEPASSLESDELSAQRARDFKFGWYADPVFHPNGDYPLSMRNRIAARSKKEGFSKSRLPQFTEEEIKCIRGTYDFLGLNHYTTRLVTSKAEEAISDPDFEKDLGILEYSDPAWSESALSWLKVVPWGLRKMLNYIKDKYGDVEIYITENGYADNGQLVDRGRIEYHQQYLDSLLDAIHEDKVNVKGYAIWSLIDNFEWQHGYTKRFGLYHVDFNDPLRPRKEKASARFYKEVVTSRKLPKLKNDLLD